MNLDKVINTSKNILKNASSIGIGALFGDLSLIILPEVSLPVRICSSIASYMLGLMLIDKTDEYIDQKAEEIKNELTEKD